MLAVLVNINSGNRILYWAESDLQSHTTGNAPLTIGPNPLVIHAAFGALQVREATMAAGLSCSIQLASRDCHLDSNAFG